MQVAGMQRLLFDLFFAGGEGWVGCMNMDEYHVSRLLRWCLVLFPVMTFFRVLNTLCLGEFEDLLTFPVPAAVFSIRILTKRKPRVRDND